MKKQRVLVSIPLAPKEGICEYVSTMCQLVREDKRYDTDISYPCSSPSEASRSVGLKAFWDGEYDYWLSIDSDNPPGVNPLDLIDYDLDLVGLPTPVHQHNEKNGKATLRWNVYRRVGVEYAALLPSDFELHEVDAIGTGCFLVARRVFEHQEMRHQPFQRIWKPDGTVELGSDMAFCERVKSAGFKVYAHWGYMCNHFTVVNLLEMMVMQKESWDAGVKEGKRQCEMSSKNSEMLQGTASPSIPKEP